MHSLQKSQSTLLGLVFILALLVDGPVTAQDSGASAVGPGRDAMGKPTTAVTREKLEDAESNIPIGDFADGSRIADHASEVLIASLARDASSATEGASVAPRERPARLHPVLWPRLQYQTSAGELYRLADGLYQIRDGLIYSTLVRGDTGWILIDAGLTVEATSVLWELARQHLPGGSDVPISAVIYSHSHADHFGGVKGFLSQAEADARNVEIIAPFGFMNELVSESILAGPAMRRRAEYAFGRLLAPKPDASELAFATLPPGTISLIPPTVELPQGPGEITVREVDGVTIYFKDISGAEAPASTLMYLPKYKMLFNSELMWSGLHNVYTLRGAKVRDALLWSKLINESILEWGSEIELITGPHGPTFAGNEKILEFMRAQRDNYGFIHNQTMRLVNRGVKIQDIGEAVDEIVPESLRQLWHTQQYHGTYSHNARAVVNGYLGFYDGNPATLNRMQTLPQAIKYVEYMGGAVSVIEKARADFEGGNYRFAATVLDKVVTAEPDNWEARHLLADTFEQLAYQTEAPQWRNSYLSASKELRAGKVLRAEDPPGAATRDLVNAATTEHLLDSLAVRLNGPAADGKNLTLNLVVTDTGETFYIELSHSNLSSIQVAAVMEADATIRVSKPNLTVLLAGIKPMHQMQAEGLLDVGGDPAAPETLLGLLGAPDLHFELVPARSRSRPLSDAD